MPISLDQRRHVLAVLGREVKRLDRFETGDPAPYINLRPWGVVNFLAGVYHGDDPRKIREQRDVERAIRWTLRELERAGEITIYRDSDGFMAGVWLGDVPSRKKVAVSDREIVMARDQYACVLCGATSDLTIDHIFPAVHGGSDAALNLRVLCRSCNSTKGAAIPDAIRLIGKPRHEDDQ